MYCARVLAARERRRRRRENGADDPVLPPSRSLRDREPSLLIARRYDEFCLFSRAKISVTRSRNSIRLFFSRATSRVASTSTCPIRKYHALLRYRSRYRQRYTDDEHRTLSNVARILFTDIDRYRSLTYLRMRLSGPAIIRNLPAL